MATPYLRGQNGRPQVPLMSSRTVPFLAAALLAAAVLVPAASAQAPGAALAIQIQDLPASAKSNDTVLAIPFKVHATVTGASPCLGAATSGSQYTIDLSATVTNSTGGNISRAIVNPKQVTIAGPVLLPAAGGNAERTEGATLLVYPAPYSGMGLNATIKVTASFSGSNGGCTGQAASAASQDSKEVKTSFTPPHGFGTSTGSANAPFPGAGVLLVALGLVAVALRQKKN